MARFGVVGRGEPSALKDFNWLDMPAIIGTLPSATGRVIIEGTLLIDHSWIPANILVRHRICFSVLDMLAVSRLVDISDTKG